MHFINLFRQRLIWIIHVGYIIMHTWNRSGCVASIINIVDLMYERGLIVSLHVDPRITVYAQHETTESSYSENQRSSFGWLTYCVRWLDIPFSVRTIRAWYHFLMAATIPILSVNSFERVDFPPLNCLSRRYLVWLHAECMHFHQPRLYICKYEIWLWVCFIAFSLWIYWKIQ